MAPVRRPDSPVPLGAAAWYSREDVHRYFSSGQNFNSLPTQPDYKLRFDELLAGYGLNEAAELIEDLDALARETPDETEREVLAKARIGQGRFRANLVAAWGKGETCALTGLDLPEMLIASHIKPWRESSNAERLDPMNGLLLVAHADRLFDRYLMSFQEFRGGFVSVLHPRIRLNVEKMGLKSGMTLATNRLGLMDEQRFRRYVAAHFERYSELVNLDKPTR